MDIRIEFYDSEGFGLVTCPFCFHQENLEASIEDNWDCAKCGREFWITPARIITRTIPTLAEHGFERRDPIQVTVREPDQNDEIDHVIEREYPLPGDGEEEDNDGDFQDSILRDHYWD